MDNNKKVKARNYNFQSVQGISQNQLQQHYKLYDGYIKNLNLIMSESRDASDYQNSNATFSPMRSLKKGETYALDGVKLHELYFENMTNSSGSASNSLLALIRRDFISYENFLNYFKQAGLAVRGWVVVVIDPRTDSLEIIGQDAHDEGPIWDACPLLVMDVYEHAYMIDFGIDRSAYIDTFIKNINWNVVNDRLNKYMRLKAAESYRFL